MHSSDLPNDAAERSGTPLPATQFISRVSAEQLSKFDFSPHSTRFRLGTPEYEADLEQRAMACASLAMVKHELPKVGDHKEDRNTMLKGITRLVHNVRDPEHADRLGDAIVRELLTRLAQNLDDADLRTHYLSSSISENDRLLVLKHCSGTERMAFLESILELSASNAVVTKFVESKLGNCLAFTSVDERAQLTRKLLLEKDNPFYISLCVRILGASNSLQELSETVGCVGSDLLLSTSDALLKDLVVRARYGTRLRELLPPVDLIEGTDPAEIQQARDSLEARLNQAITLLREQEGDKPEGLAGRFLEIAHSDLELLKERLKSPKNWEEIAESINLINFKAWLEMRYGLQLTDEAKSFFSPGAQWSMEELTQAAEALQRLPEGLLYRTPLLTEIQRVHSLGIGVMGQRFDDGIIRITDQAIDNQSVEASYEGFSSLEVVLTHEIGHGVQIGATQLSFVIDGEGRLTLSEGDPEYEFGEFSRISGWELVDPARIKLSDNQYTIYLDGQETPVGLPALHDGKFIMLIANQGLVFIYRLDAEFSVVPYSRTNPWEDWAEAFCEYFLRPDRLIRRAPQKFKYLEDQFHHFGERGDLLAALKKRLEPK